MFLCIAKQDMAKTTSQSFVIIAGQNTLSKNTSRLQIDFPLEQKIFFSFSPPSLTHAFAKPKWTRTGHTLMNVYMPYWQQCFFSRVKKPDEFNRPRIPYSQRKIKARSSKFLSKKVNSFLCCFLKKLPSHVLFLTAFDVFPFSDFKEEKRNDQT